MRDGEPPAALTERLLPVVDQTQQEVAYPWNRQTAIGDGFAGNTMVLFEPDRSRPVQLGRGGVLAMIVEEESSVALIP